MTSHCTVPSHPDPPAVHLFEDDIGLNVPGEYIVQKHFQYGQSQIMQQM